MSKILSPIAYLTNKINDKDFAWALTNIVYQYCTNADCRPTSLDNVYVAGYCQVIRSNHGLLPDEYGNDFEEDRDEFNVIVLYNPEEKWYTYLALPVLNLENDIYKYIFASGDFCYWNVKDGINDETSIISNSSGDELLVETFGFDKGNVSGSKIFPNNFIQFSKLCLKYCGKSNVPSVQELVKKYNKK